MGKTVVVMRELSPEEQRREIERFREKRLHDETTALNHAWLEGFKEGFAESQAERDAELAAKWRKRGFSEKQIQELLGKN